MFSQRASVAEIGRVRIYKVVIKLDILKPYKIWFRRIVKGLCLSGAERQLALEAAFLLFAVWCGLRIFQFSHVAAWTSRIAKRPGDLRVDRVAHWVAVMGSVFKMSCLVQALAGQRMIARRGALAVLRFGVADTTETTVDAHAWLELQGQMLIGAGVAQSTLPLTASSPPR